MPQGGLGDTVDVTQESDAAATEGQPWPSPIRERLWTDSDGTQWHMRGQALDHRAARRLLRRSGIRVLHVYGSEPELLQHEALDDVLARFQQFADGVAQPHSDFRIADFRDEAHNVMAVIEESC